jgi:glycosyltransferase involved in cell wall biosynthesis
MTLRQLDFDFGGMPYLPPGYDFPMTAWLVNALLGRGHKVVAYTTSTGIKEPLICKDDRLTICIAPRRDRHAARDFFKRERMFLKQLMTDYPADIINAHWTYEFALAALDTGLPTVVTIHDHALTVLRYQFDPYRFMRLLMNYRTLHRARFMSANSEYLWSLLVGGVKRKTLVIPDFYHSRLEQPPLGEKKDQIVSACNGFGRIKNLHNGLLAFRELRKSHLGIRYILLGDDMETGGAAYQFARRHSADQDVTFLGKRSHEDVVREVRAARVLLHPSREESFGMSVLESMVLGTPVVGGVKSGNIPFLLDHGRCGLLCDVESPYEIASSVSKLLSNADMAGELACRAREYVMNRFSERVVVGKYLDYFSEVIARS